MNGTRALRPGAWLNRLAHSYPTLSNLLDGLPTDEYSLMKELTERFNSLDARLGSSKGDSEMCLGEIRLARTFLGSLKKFRLPIEGYSGPDLAASAITGWITRNSKAADNSVPLKFRDDMRSFLRFNLEGYSDAIADPRFGPGAVEERLSIVDRWNGVSSNADYNYSDPGRIADLGYDGSCAPSCRLQAVPKDWNKMRLITVEPYLNSYLQHYSRRKLLCVLTHCSCADLRSIGDPRRSDPQLRHRRLCMRGSMDGLLATLDLSNASDLVSFRQVTDVFPVDVLADLERSRTFTCRYDNHSTYINMYAGMGNATTFIVETLMFHAACYAIARYYRLPYRDSFISVFGDDIIVSAKLAPLVVEAFKGFGWEVNTSKSYYDVATRFRESCGIQAYCGLDVTLLRYGGSFNGTLGIPSLCDLIRRCATTSAFVGLVAEPWPELGNIANSTQFSSPGALITSVPWWPNSCDCSTRFSKENWTREGKLPFVYIPSTVHQVRTIGPVYGALSGQLAQKSGSRRFHGRKYYGVVDEVPRLASCREKWFPLFSDTWLPN